MNFAAQFHPQQCYVPVFGATRGYWPSTFTGDSFFSCPGGGNHLNQGGNLPDNERLPGITEFPTSYTAYTKFVQRWRLAECKGALDPVLAVDNG